MWINVSSSNGTSGESGGAQWYMWAAEAPYLCTFYLSQVMFLFSCYCTLVVCLWRTPRFHTSGYMMLVSMMSAEQMVNIFWFLGGTLPITLYYYGLVDYPYQLASHIAHIDMFCFYCSALHVVAIAIQRYYSVAYYANYNRVFSMTNTRRLIAGIWVTAILFTIPYSYWAPVRIYFSVEYFSLVHDQSHPLTKLWNTLLSVGFNGALTFFMITLGCMFIYKFKQIKKTSSSSRPIAKLNASVVAREDQETGTSDRVQDTAAKSSVRNDEMRLTMQILILVFLWVLELIIWFIWNTILSYVTIDLVPLKIIYSLQSFVNIWTFGFDALLIMIMNRGIRDQVSQMLAC